MIKNGQNKYFLDEKITEKRRRFEGIGSKKLKKSGLSKLKKNLFESIQNKMK